MTRGLVALALALLGCSGATPPATCTPEAREALMTFYGQVSGEVIGAGACDKYDRVEECPAFMAVEAQFLAARKGICP